METRSYQYRLYPTVLQVTSLQEMLEDTRRLYNAALEERIGSYRRTGRSVTFNQQCLHLKTIRSDEPDGIGRWAYTAGNRVLYRLDKAFRLASRTRNNYPRYKGSDRWKSVELFTGNGLRIDNSGKIIVIGIPGLIKVKWDRPFPDGSKLGAAYICCRGGRWSVTFVVKAEFRSDSCGTGSVGVDLGLNSLVATSDGEVVAAPRLERRSSRRIRVLQRALARCRRGSKRRAKAKLRLASARARVARQRADHAHKLSRRLVRRYEMIVFEDLKVEHMKRSRFGRSICDAGWSQLVNFVTYKAESAGGSVVLVDPRYTSQDCPDCGRRERKPLSLRRHTCSCGCDLDRDVAAARVILDRAGSRPSDGKLAGCGVVGPKSLVRH